jgi:CheY-like chemotaxis protein/anti-sigma regulatory factor (Ser/Thr protein kinase)
VGGVLDVTIEAETDRSLRQMEKMKALAEVAGGVSHDFNNLLTAIISAAELIEWQLAAESPIRLKLQVIYQAVMRARELNRQILAFSRNSEEKFSPFDLSAVVKEAAHLIRSTFPATVEVRSTLVSGLWTTGSGAQLHQVVMNIAINALQAMLPAGGILEIDLVDQGGSAVLTLRDSGCGMAPEVLDRIFEPFFTTKERAAGKGLGLSVVHGIVQNHGGAIQVRSRPGLGSAFQVTLPCTTRDQPAEEAAPSEASPNGTERILFVDDEEVLAALGKQGLQLLGYRVTSRSDSQEALEEFTHHAQDFDLLVTDLSMPGMSGVELTQQIRRIRPDLPAILVTGAFQDPLPLEGMSTPFAEVLLKPVTILDMAKAARRVLNLRPAPKSPSEQAPDATQRPEATGVILLAEDSHTTRSLLRSWLVKAGYQVEEARDGQEAWEAMDQNRGRYSVLVTDIVMPRMDGLKLTAKVRELDPSIPILMLSSSEDTDSVKEALHLHVNEFLSKPFESTMLVDTVGRLCADQATRLKVLRSHETAQAVRMAQRAMEAIPEKDMPIYSISEPLTDAGGDVFRAFRREDGSIFFAIADVAGHSVISSYAVAAFLGMLTNFLASDLDLRSLAMKLNRAIQAGPFSEVPICGLFGHWDPPTGRIHLLNAGIPHALWHRSVRGATQPIAINGTPLGVLDEPLVEDTMVILAPGDRLLLGSDGFFDAVSPENTPFYDLAASIWENLRSTDLFQAINLVSEAARAHSGGNFGDDLLVVALEQPALAPDPDRLNLLIPSSPEAIDQACDALSAFLDGRGWTSGNRYDTLLAVREALSNAMIHGNGSGDGLVNLWAAWKGAGGFQVGVLDEGQGFDLGAHQPPDTESSERGRGIPLIRHFTRDVTMVGGELTMTFD